LAVLSGFFEMTTGTTWQASGKRNPPGQLAAVSLLLGWAGLSVHFRFTAL